LRFAGATNSCSTAYCRSSDMHLPPYLVGQADRYPRAT
jgi:hypothetical protein